MDKKEYHVTTPGLDWVAGKRVQEGEPLMLTEAQAAHDLARGNIAEGSTPAKVDAGDDSAIADALAGKPGKQGRKET